MGQNQKILYCSVILLEETPVVRTAATPVPNGWCLKQSPLIHLMNGLAYRSGLDEFLLELGQHNRAEHFVTMALENLWVSFIFVFPEPSTPECAFGSRRQCKSD